MESEQILPAICPNCGSTEIIYAESSLKVAKPYHTGHASSEQQPNEAKMNYLDMGMNVLVCTDCGYSTFYAKEPQKLKHRLNKKNLS